MIWGFNTHILCSFLSWIFFLSTLSQMLRFWNITKRLVTLSLILLFVSYSYTCTHTSTSMYARAHTHIYAYMVSSVFASRPGSLLTCKIISMFILMYLFSHPTNYMICLNKRNSVRTVHRFKDRISAMFQSLTVLILP